MSKNRGSFKERATVLVTVIALVDVEVAPEVFPNGPDANGHEGRDIRAPIDTRGGAAPSNSLDATQDLPNNHEPKPYQDLAL